MSSKSKKRKNPKKPHMPSIDMLSADTTINVLSEELSQFKEVYKNKAIETNCPACNWTMQILKKHCETLEDAIQIIRLYGEHPEQAARFLITSHALYYDAIRTISLISMEATENVHEVLDPCPHQVEGNCELSCKAHGDKQPPEQKPDIQN